MPTLFRKIREALLSQNRFTKYLLYAIGEIVLVVLGILIALQVNNWNNKQKDTARLNHLIKKLKVQTSKNIENLSFSISSLEYSIKYSENHIGIIGSMIESESSAKLDTLIYVNSIDHYLNLDLNVITESRENDDLSLIKNDSLRKTIYDLVSFNEIVVERERITNEDLNMLFVPYLNKNYNFRNSLLALGLNMGESKLNKRSNLILLNDQDFENLMVSRIAYSKDLRTVYSNLNEIVLNLKRHLNSQ